MVNVALSLSTKATPNIPDRHWTLVPLYLALAGMVRVCTAVPSGVVLSETTRSLRMSGKRISRSVPLTLHEVIPPLVSHVKTAGWFRKTVVLLGAWRISGKNETKTVGVYIYYNYAYVTSPSIYEFVQAWFIIMQIYYVNDRNFVLWSPLVLHLHSCQLD